MHCWVSPYHMQDHRCQWSFNVKFSLCASLLQPFGILSHHGLLSKYLLWLITQGDFGGNIQLCPFYGEEVDIHLCAKCKELFSSKVCASLKEGNNFPDIVSFDHQQNFLKIHPITRAGVIHVVLISFPKLPKQDI